MKTSSLLPYFQFFASMLKIFTRKISDKNINTERQTIAKNFIQDFSINVKIKTILLLKNFNVARNLRCF